MWISIKTKFAISSLSHHVNCYKNHNINMELNRTFNSDNAIHNSLSKFSICPKRDSTPISKTPDLIKSQHSVTQENKLPWCQTNPKFSPKAAFTLGPQLSLKREKQRGIIKKIVVATAVGNSWMRFRWFRVENYLEIYEGKRRSSIFSSDRYYEADGILTEILARENIEILSTEKTKFCRVFFCVVI